MVKPILSDASETTASKITAREITASKITARVATVNPYAPTDTDSIGLDPYEVADEIARLVGHARRAWLSLAALPALGLFWPFVFLMVFGVMLNQSRQMLIKLRIQDLPVPEQLKHAEHRFYVAVLTMTCLTVLAVAIFVLVILFSSTRA